MSGKKRLLVVGAVLVTAAAMVSVGLAAIGDGGTIKTCFAKNQGTWRPIDTTANCKSGETALDFYSKAGADAAFLGKTAKAADSDKLDGVDSTGFLGATAMAADSDKLDGVDSTGFLGATAKAADSDKLDGIDSLGFVQGKSGWDVRRVINTNSLAFNSTGAPFGSVNTYCDPFAGNAIFYFFNSTGSQLDVFDQMNGGAPTFFSMAPNSNTPEQYVSSTQRRTWAVSNGTDYGEIDIWARWNGSSCNFMIHTSFGKS